jgi:hypothetical protein
MTITQDGAIVTYEQAQQVLGLSLPAISKNGAWSPPTVSAILVSRRAQELKKKTLIQRMARSFDRGDRSSVVVCISIMDGYVTSNFGYDACTISSKAIQNLHAFLQDNTKTEDDRVLSSSCANSLIRYLDAEVGGHFVSAEVLKGLDGKRTFLKTHAPTNIDYQAILKEQLPGVALDYLQTQQVNAWAWASAIMIWYVLEPTWMRAHFKIICKVNFIKEIATELQDSLPSEDSSFDECLRRRITYMIYRRARECLIAVKGAAIDKGRADRVVGGNSQIFFENGILGVGHKGYTLGK